GAESHTDTDFASALTNADEHYVHNTETAEEERSDSDGAHENFHANDDHTIGLGTFYGVPEAGGFCIARIEIGQTGEGAAKLADTVLVSVDRPWSDQKVIYGVFDSRRLVGEIATHSVERNKNLSGVETVVTGILFFGFHYADDGIGDAIHPNGLAEGLAFGKQLFLGIAAEKRHVAGVFVVFVVVEAALRSCDA